MDKYETAVNAINAVFTDRSVPAETTKERLSDLRDLLDELAETLE